MNARNTTHRKAILILSMLLMGGIGYFAFEVGAANPARLEQGRQRPQAQQPTEDLPELRTSQTFEPGQVPKCPGPPREYLGGIMDGFAGGIEPSIWSPELTAFFSGKPTRKFDEGGADKLFGQSFRLGNCKVCAVQLEAKIKDEGDIPPYDKIYVYGKNIAAPDLIWATTISPSITSFSAYLPPSSIAKLNQHIFTNAPGHWLNVVEQDDRNFDYLKVRVWYY